MWSDDNFWVVKKSGYDGIFNPDCGLKFSYLKLPQKKIMALRGSKAESSPIPSAMAEWEEDDWIGRFETGNKREAEQEEEDGNGVEIYNQHSVKKGTGRRNYGTSTEQ